MLFNARNLVAWFALLALAAATVWAVSFKPEPPADFTFANEAEVKSVDPSIITGQLEGRIVDCLFEGLTRWDPKTLEPKPGVAESWEISPDKKTYTFHLRHDAKWSDGTPCHRGRFSLGPSPGPRSANRLRLFLYLLDDQKRARNTTRCASKPAIRSKSS